MAPEATYILYHDPVSICSVMVRYTLALRGKAKDEDASLHVQERLCSLKNRDHLTEEFLCDVNPKGEVPVLVPAEQNTSRLGTIPDSVDITYFIADRHPGLLPSEKEEAIRKLMSDLHAINFFSLTFTDKPQMQQQSASFLEAKLSTENDMSEQYRKAIQNKIERIREGKLPGLEPQSVENAIRRTNVFLAEIAELLDHSTTGWILNTADPTALDAHVVVFICRLQDVDRQNLIPDQVQQYAEVAMAQEAWEEVMSGRRTVPPGGF